MRDHVLCAGRGAPVRYPAGNLKRPNGRRRELRGERCRIFGETHFKRERGPCFGAVDAVTIRLSAGADDIFIALEFLKRRFRESAEVAGIITFGKIPLIYKVVL